ncbi:MAG: cysteine desulfurase [Methylotenera sp.]|nr:cysteine desulfurase [Oligoflexia bacterium]
MSARPAIYLDSNAGAPLHPEVAAALLPFLSSSENFVHSNPSSLHAFGRKARKALNQARTQILQSLGLPGEDKSRAGTLAQSEVVFTSSGTEANHMAIRSALRESFSHARSSTVPPSPFEKTHWIATAVEHDSVLQLIEEFRGAGGEVDFLPVNADGVSDPESLQALLKPHTALVSILWVNNETGVIQPLTELIATLQRHQKTQTRPARLHVDAAQAWGKLPIVLRERGEADCSTIDYLTLSGHKIGALAGTGVLWARSRRDVSPLMPGKQQNELRGGTENLLGIVSLGAAASAMDPDSYRNELAPLRDELQDAISKRIPGVWVNGVDSARVANTLSLSFDHLQGEGLVQRLDLAGYCVSSGSACASGTASPSHVLMAMGRSEAQARASLRISLCRGIRREELKGFVNALEDAVARFRSS